MTNIPVSDFEQRLRKATKWRHHNDAVKEIVGHYQDLFQEALHKGASIDEARKFADENIGNVSEIAKGIRGGNGKSNGMKLQWIAMAVFVFGTFFYVGLSFLRIGNGSPIWSNWNFDPEPIGTGIVYVAGVILGVGVLKMKKLLWPAIVLGLLMIPIGSLCTKIITFKSLSHYQSVTTMLRKDRVNYPIVEQPKYNHRLELLSACLLTDGTDNHQNLEAFSVAMRVEKNMKGFVLPREETGKWVFPSKIQKILPARLPYLYLASTNSYDIAKNAWQSSDVLRKALPEMKLSAKDHFESFTQMPAQKFSIQSVLVKETVLAVIPFSSSFVLTFMLFGIATKLRQLVKGNRRAL